MDQLVRVQLDSNRLLQQNYFLLQASSNMCSSLREQFERIRRLNQRQHEVTFDDGGVNGNNKEKYGGDEDLANLTIGPGFLTNGNSNGYPDESILATCTTTDTTICITKRTYDECNVDDTAAASTKTVGLMLPPARKLFKENHSTATIAAQSSSSCNFNETITINVSSDSINSQNNDPSATITKPSQALTRVNLLMGNNKLKTKGNLIKKIELTDNGINKNPSTTKFNNMPSKIKNHLTTINKENKKHSPGRMNSRKSPRPKTPRMLLMQRKSKLISFQGRKFIYVFFISSSSNIISSSSCTISIR